MKNITEKQMQILRLLDYGMSVSEIAEEMKLTDTSIRAQIKRIAVKVKKYDLVLPLTPIEKACLPDYLSETSFD
jgi:DNA-binding NarL/FixJ family response regulator